MSDKIGFWERRARNKMCARCGIAPSTLPDEVRWPMAYDKTEYSPFWVWLGRIAGIWYGILMGLMLGIFYSWFLLPVGIAIGAYIGIFLGRKIGKSRPSYTYARVYVIILNKLQHYWWAKWFDPMMQRNAWDVLYDIPGEIVIPPERIYPYKGPAPENRSKFGPAKFRNWWGNKRLGICYIDERNPTCFLTPEDMGSSADFTDLDPLLLKDFVDSDPAKNWTESIKDRNGGGWWIWAIVGSIAVVVVLKLMGVV